MKNTARYLLASSLLLGSLALAETAFAAISVPATADHSARPEHATDRSDMHGKKPDMEMASHTPAIVGDGQPLVAGNVTAISGNSLTITNKDNVTYSIDVSSTTVTKANVTGKTVSGVILVGDAVIVQGTIHDTSVIASSIIDRGGVLPPTASASAEAKSNTHRSGFFGAINGFFSRLFHLF